MVGQPGVEPESGEFPRAQRHFPSGKMEVASQKRFLLRPERELSSRKRFLLRSERELSSRERFLLRPEMELPSRERFFLRPKRELPSRERFFLRPERELSSRERFLLRPERELSGPSTRNHRPIASLLENTCLKLGQTCLLERRFPFPVNTQIPFRPIRQLPEPHHLPALIQKFQLGIGHQPIRTTTWRWRLVHKRV